MVSACTSRACMALILATLFLCGTSRVEGIAALKNRASTSSGIASVTCTHAAPNAIQVSWPAVPSSDAYMVGLFRSNGSGPGVTVVSNMPEHLASTDGSVPFTVFTTTKLATTLKGLLENTVYEIRLRSHNASSPSIVWGWRPWGPSVQCNTSSSTAAALAKLLAEQSKITGMEERSASTDESHFAEALPLVQAQHLGSSVHTLTWALHNVRLWLKDATSTAAAAAAAKVFLRIQQWKHSDNEDKNMLYFNKNDGSPPITGGADEAVSKNWWIYWHLQLDNSTGSVAIQPSHEGADGLSLINLSVLPCTDAVSATSLSEPSPATHPDQDDTLCVQASSLDAGHRYALSFVECVEATTVNALHNQRHVDGNASSPYSSAWFQRPRTNMTCRRVSAVHIHRTPEVDVQTAKATGAAKASSKFVAMYRVSEYTNDIDLLPNHNSGDLVAESAFLTNTNDALFFNFTANPPVAKYCVEYQPAPTSNGWAPYVSCNGPEAAPRNDPSNPICICDVFADRMIGLQTYAEFEAASCGNVTWRPDGSHGYKDCKCHGDDGSYSKWDVEPVSRGHVGYMPVWLPFFYYQVPQPSYPNITQIGGFFSTPRDTYCGLGASTLGEKNCTWRDEARIDLIYGDSLLELGWNTTEQPHWPLHQHGPNTTAQVQQNLPVFEKAWHQHDKHIQPMCCGC